MGKKWLRRALALVMIVAGLVGFLWEFPVTDNKYCTVWDTHYGNRFEYHTEQPNLYWDFSHVKETSTEAAVRKVLAEKTSHSRWGVRFGDRERNVPGIEWLTEPILPEGCYVREVIWYADYCMFLFSGEFSGSITNLREDTGYYRIFVEEYERQTAEGENSEWYSVGDLKVSRALELVEFVGVRNGFYFRGSVQVPRGTEFTDAQIQELGIRLAVPQSWEVTLLVLVNVLRGVCLATAVTGVVMLVIPVLKRKKTAPAVL